MKKPHIPTVTIAISAYNEERNIGAFLKSVIGQKEKEYKLKQIWIFNDGSTDNTLGVIKKIKSKKIRIFDDEKRKGKSFRLNKLYALLDTDFLVQSDADVTLAHPYVIYKMIHPLIQDTSVGMCGGNPTPLPGITFIEKAVNCTCSVYIPLRTKLKNGNNAFSSDGRMLSYRKEFIQSVHIPVNMIANDAYTYYCCLKKGYSYIHAQGATVYYRSPQTLSDQIKQNTRFKASPIRLEKYFSKKLLKKEMHIPKRAILNLFIKEYIKHPILCTSIFLINLYCSFKAKRVEDSLNGKWAMAFSTKKL